MGINKVGVLGAGTMGAGIAQVSAEAGLSVVLGDVDASIVAKAMKGIMKSWQKAVEKGKLDETAKAQRVALIKTTSSMSEFSDCDVVIEAIVENMDIKKKVFSQLDEICKPDTILSSNTSALSITEIATATRRADKVVGMHFFNPVPVMKLVEVIPGSEATDAAVDTIMELCRKIGKEPVKAKECPGFIVNRILVPYLNEAAFAYQDGVGTVEEIDKAMKLGANMPIGPLALCDMVGIDVLLSVCDYYWREFGDSKYRPSLALKQKFRAGHLGIKSGRGFYDYKK
ncbi:MAG TPA: 3-hydroxyacyl-CoA dehydrogenase NAD-binding domain-containing protein [Syntrophomonas sp.]|nr:3-hydroxyacyl-CoA dehydrogenase NAD-binding domain-containing protein [Syntrophomonas sp.]